MVQVQLRLSEETVKEIDEQVRKSKFKSRSEAIRTMIALHQEREKTREFYAMLTDRSREVKETPEILIPFESKWHIKNGSGGADPSLHTRGV